MFTKFSVDTCCLTITFVQFNDTIFFFYKLITLFDCGGFTLGFECSVELLVKILEYGFDITRGTLDILVQLSAFFNGSHSTIGQSKEG